MNRIYLTAVISIFMFSCKSSDIPQDENPIEISSNIAGTGQELTVSFTRGTSHNHPLMAVWISDENDEYIQTLYVAESIGKGIFDHGDATSGKWLPGAIRRPGALPVWSFARGVTEEDGLFIPTPEHAIPDAYTGATPEASFNLSTKLDKQRTGKINVYFEINQTWDWNEYWTNNKYPDDDVYKTSCQPSLIYHAEVDLDKAPAEYEMTVIGRGHHSGQDGKIYTDLETMTTALDIAKMITVETH